MPNILKETARGIDVILLDDELFSNREIFFTDEVNTTSATLLLKQLMYLDRADTGKEITLYINSLGGDVISGLAVYDFIRLMKSPVRTVCTGTAASMGAILFLAGTTRQMLPHTRLLIHDPSYGSNDIGGQKSHEIQQQLDKLNEVRETLAKIIAEKTGKRLKEIYKVTATDTCFSAEEAVAFGLATEILTEV